MSSRCRARTFHGTPCLNLVSDDDPRYCHIHSPTYRRCLATHERNDRPCRRKPIGGSAFCAHHQARTVGQLSARERRELMSGSRGVPVVGYETGRFRG